MAIFIHVEVSSRELDSKLLLAVLAVSRGYSVLLGDVIAAVEKPFFKAGLFHTKSVGATGTAFNRHAKIKRRGHVLTSIDEEGALVGVDIEKLTRTRFSQAAMANMDAVFAWGPQDFNSLRNHYPDFAEKIHRAGSPRVDLWRPMFSNYWRRLNSFPTRPFLLFSASKGFTKLTFLAALKNLEGRVVGEDLPSRRAQLLKQWSEHFGSLDAVADLMKELSNHAVKKRYEIVIRPHPFGDIEPWFLVLGHLPNVTILRDQSVSHWVRGAFATVHDGSTTATEAVVAEQPLITLLPTVLGKNPQRRGAAFASQLGIPVTNSVELKAAVEELLAANVQGKTHKVRKGDKERVSRRLYIRDRALASTQIVDVWEKLTERSSPSRHRLGVFRGFLLAKKIRDRALASVHWRRLGRKQRQGYIKFPPLDIESTGEKILNLQTILGIRSNLRVSQLGERTILLQPGKKN